MVTSNHYFIFKVVCGAKFVEILEERDEVLFAPVVGEVSSMDEDISLHCESRMQGLETAVGVGNYQTF
jgi:hypothetical protein